MDSSESESEGDICGIIEADGLTLEELPAISPGLGIGISMDDISCELMGFTGISRPLLGLDAPS